jgi:exopolysaccharide biosynthesis protein
MKKFGFLLSALVFVVFFVACQGKDPIVDVSTTNTPLLTDQNQQTIAKANQTQTSSVPFTGNQIQPVELFSLFSTPEELLSELRKNDVVIQDPYEDSRYNTESMGITNPINDGRIYNHDQTYWYSCEDINFFFNEDGKMNGISTKSPRYLTNEGICVGDSKEKVMMTYGEKFFIDQETFADGTKSPERYGAQTVEGFYLFIFDEENRLVFWNLCDQWYQIAD